MKDKELLLISIACIFTGGTLLLISYSEFADVGRLFGYGIWAVLIGLLAITTWILRAIRPPQS
jgi:hypothetical protein